MSRHQVSPAALTLIKTFEGLRRRSARLEGGGWTVGYGHTRSAREGIEIDEADAEALLRYDLQAVETAVNEAVFTPLTQNQYDALVAFAFNVGVEAFRRSNVLRRVNEGDLLGAATALESWRRAPFEGEPIVIDALVRRRAAEKALFLTPTDGFIAAPSPVLKPQLDFGLLAGPVPARAKEVVTPLDGDTARAERADDALPSMPTPPEPSPAVAAAEAVSRRLQALFADDEPARESPVSLDKAEPDREPSLFDTPPELIADPALSLAPDAEPVPPPADIEATGGDEPYVEPEASFDQRIARSDFDDAAAQPAAERESSWPYLILGLLALVLFVIAVVFILDARSKGEVGLFETQSLLGTVFGLIAIGGFCTAVYFWLKTLGANGEGEGKPKA